LEVSTLRKMLKLHFQESIQRAMSLLESKPPTLEFFPLNMERVLDDFVFMYVMFLHLSITCFM
jgi:5'-3' exonuclease